MKDNFSSNSADYAKFRPDYPDAVFEWLKKNAADDAVAWDVGTGNGQVAYRLAEFCDRVEASDISENQLANARKKANIHYSLHPAEQTSFQEASFHLITIAQAIHWFDFEQFYAEVRRVAKPGALIVVLGYGLIEAEGPADGIIKELYYETLKDYWDAERKWIDEAYLTIPFPFKELEKPEFVQNYSWTPEALYGYLSTWSAVKHYKEKNGADPLEIVFSRLKELGDDKIEVRFPILLRAGVKD